MENGGNERKCSNKNVIIGLSGCDFQLSACISRKFHPKTFSSVRNTQKRTSIIFLFTDKRREINEMTKFRVCNYNFSFSNSNI